MKLVSRKLALAISLAVLTSSSAMAATATSTFNVTATVAAACNVSATNMAFGSFSPAATGNLAATNTITATCTKGTPYTIAINAGSGTFAARKMNGAVTGNTDKVTYNIFKDAAYATIAGDGTAPTATFTGTGNGVAQAYTAYGQLSLNQFITPDTYTDNLTLTITY